MKMTTGTNRISRGLLMGSDEIIFYFNGTASTDTRATIELRNGTYRVFAVRLNGVNGGQLSVYDAALYEEWENVSSFSANTWHKITLAMDPDSLEMSVYLNDVLKAEGIYPGDGYSDNLSFEVVGTSGVMYFDSIQQTRRYGD